MGERLMSDRQKLTLKQDIGGYKPDTQMFQSQ